MVDYAELGVGDPLAFVFKKVGLGWMSGIVAFTALIAMASVLLIFQLGQPRIWMSMSRDGLLPKAFSRIHPRFRTPSFATIVTGIVVAVPALFMNLTEVTDLTSIGTLFAFVVVCGGVLVLQQRKTRVEGRFQVPYINGRYLVPVMMVITIFLNIKYNQDYWRDFFEWSDERNWMAAFAERLPMLLFVLTSMIITWLSYWRKLSLIPVLGLLSCMFLMTKLGHTNWMRFLVWLGIGLLFYFTFSRKNSKLNKAGTKIHGTPEL
jgi:amino acid transporter